MEEENISREKVRNLVKYAILCKGRRIKLDSNKFFGIYMDLSEKKDNERKYTVQWGDSSTDSIKLKFKIILTSTPIEIEIQHIEVSCMPNGQAAEVSRDEDVVNNTDNMPEFLRSHRTGRETSELQKYNGFANIANNEKAIQIVEAAIEDLKNSQTIGVCELVDQKGSQLVTCCLAVNEKTTDYKKGTQDDLVQ